MPTIVENQFFTPIIEFEVAPRQQQALIDGIADQVERHFKRYPGFVSASFHASEDGRRVINYAQWLSREAWAASGLASSDDDASSAAILAVIERYVTTPEKGRVDFFRVARVVDNTRPSQRVLVLGKLPEVLRTVTDPLTALGFDAQGSIDGEHAAARFDAKDFDLIVFGGALFGPVSDRLRLEFTRQNPAVEFLDAYAPIAVRQIVSALDRAPGKQSSITDFRVVEDAPDCLLRARILKPCTVRIEVFRLPDAPAPDLELVDQLEVIPGPFERRIDARYRPLGHMLVATVNGSDYFLHRMQTPPENQLS